MNKQYIQKKKIPGQPGVYFFKKGREIIYIGKATSLKDRVMSYFGKDLIETRGPGILDMIFKADGLSWQVTDTVLEALILEASLIKKYQPKYNTKEKSDKSWNYVCITKEKLPKVIIIREKNLLQKQRNFAALPAGGLRHGQNFFVSSSSVFGPFTNGSQLKEALKIIRKIFPFLDDKSKNYMKFYRQINLVPDLADRKMYLANIRNIKLFFQGKKKRILQNIKKEMNSYAKRREFEKAGELKRQIFALNHINDVALIKDENFIFYNFFSLRTAKRNSSLEETIKNSVFRIEAYDIAHMSGKNMVGVMTVVENGVLQKSEYKKFKIRTQEGSNDTGALEEILTRRFAHNEWPYPSLIVVDGGIAQLNTARKIIGPARIPIVSVLKNEQHKPKSILGDSAYGLKYKRDILLVNSEAHRFAISYHKQMRNKNFLKR